MKLTPYHAKYYAYNLTRRFPAGSDERLTGAVASAQVDLNPHQVDAALFAFQSPLSKGVLLADEVGLGKTIEAGLVLSQKIAERKHRILVITPSNLRKQWYQELTEKFFLQCCILETKTYNAAVKKGHSNPFDAREIIICSYEFARSKANDLQSVGWDIIVMDEAHRLRNVYKPGNVMANTLKRALIGKNKLLLTATPLQNSLLELYGLVSFIDEHAFGDLKSFRDQFVNLNHEQVFQALKARLKPLCHRTLRRQVSAQVPYTKRLPLLEEFTPGDHENQLYEYVSDYLQRPNLQALPTSQRSLITLVLRKLLASSTFAIAGALTSISNRLKNKIRQVSSSGSLEDDLDADFEVLDELSEEWPDDDNQQLNTADYLAIKQEIADLETYIGIAVSIHDNAKGKALLTALDQAFKTARAQGAAEKAIIFTESRRTQEYILRILENSSYSDGIVLFNGSNDDRRSNAIYSQWFERFKGTDRITGSRTADMRSALVDYFRDQGRIMIATEAGSEGINLQFCSLVVNYDLPWNPQRIEQRIGRCHRYGQKHDVVVVNFLNRKNAADKRVFELLSEKFNLFKGVFGASDEVLGVIESGVDFEKRIADIYQRCRRPEDIQAAFDQLQRDLSVEIDVSMMHTRQKLLENFDDEVREKLRIRGETSREFLSRYERLLIDLARYELSGYADFRNDVSFELLKNPFPDQSDQIPLGIYKLPRHAGDAHLYRLNHPLTKAIISQAQKRHLPFAKIQIFYKDHPGKKVSQLDPFINQSGWLTFSRFSVELQRKMASGEDIDDQDEDYLVEDHLIAIAVTDAGEELEDRLTERLFDYPATSIPLCVDEDSVEIGRKLSNMLQERINVIERGISERNARFFDAETIKLDGWADDLKIGIEREIKELDRQIKEARRAAATALSLEDKLAGQKQVKVLEILRNQKRRSLFDAQDQIDLQRDTLIAEAEAKLNQKNRIETIFTVRWVLT